MQPIPFKDRENSPLRTKFFEISITFARRNNYKKRQSNGDNKR
nr:MAG TPA: hypothetical protein [Caudoviricetes sp.]